MKIKKNIGWAILIISIIAILIFAREFPYIQMFGVVIAIWMFVESYYPVLDAIIGLILSICIFIAFIYYEYYLFAVAIIFGHSILYINGYIKEKWPDSFITNPFRKKVKKSGTKS